MRLLRSHIIESILAIALAILLISGSQAIIGVDVARTLLGTKATETEVIALQKELGLDRPFLEQVVTRTVNAFRGDLGKSYAFKRPVTPILLSAFQSSLRLITPALVIGSILGILLGIWVAYRPQGIRRSILTLTTSIALLPSLVLSTLVVYGLGFKLNWITPSYAIAVIVLSLVPLFITALTAYQEYSKILVSYHTQAARSFGFSESRIALSSLKEAAVALTANLTNLILYMLTATVFVEISFSFSGLGNLLLMATERLDYPIITGVALVIVVIFGVMNVISGVALYALDPRTR